MKERVQKPAPRDEPPPGDRADRDDRDDVRVGASPVRCPFCHDGIDVAGEAWVACAGCVARHHAECWDEAGRCGVCRGGERLTREGAAPAAPAAGGRRRIVRLPRRLERDRREVRESALLGGPTRVLLERRFAGELDLAREGPWLSGEVRRALRVAGAWELRGSTLRWTAGGQRQGRQDCGGTLSVTLESRGGETTLRVEDHPGSVAWGVVGGVGGGLGGGLAWLVVLLYARLVAGVDPQSLGAAAVLVVAVWLVAVLGLVARPLSGWLTRRRFGQVERLADRLTARLADPKA